MCYCFPLCPATCEEAQKRASEEESEEGEGMHQEEGDTVVPRRTTNSSKSAQLIRRLNADKPRVKKATKLNHSKKYHCTFAKTMYMEAVLQVHVMHCGKHIRDLPVMLPLPAQLMLSVE